MGRSSREGRPSTRPTWETLEAWVRMKVQELVQAVLEEEVTEALGRQRYERRDGIDAPVRHRNGYGKPRRFRRLDAPAQLAVVYDGRMFRDWKLVKEKTLKAAA